MCRIWETAWHWRKSNWHLKHVFFSFPGRDEQTSGWVRVTRWTEGKNAPKPFPVLCVWAQFFPHSLFLLFLFFYFIILFVFWSSKLSNKIPLPPDCHSQNMFSLSKSPALQRHWCEAAWKGNELLHRLHCSVAIWLHLSCAWIRERKQLRFTKA